MRLPATFLQELPFAIGYLILATVVLVILSAPSLDVREMATLQQTRDSIVEIGLE